MRYKAAILGITVCFLLTLLFVPSEHSKGVSENYGESLPSSPETTRFIPAADSYHYVSDVGAWSWGYVDGYYYGQPDFSLAKLQSANSDFSVLFEAVAVPTCRFEYIFSLDISGQSSFVDHYIQTYGRCSSNTEPLAFSWSISLGGPYTSLGSLTETSNTYKSWSVSISGSATTVYVKVGDTFSGVGDPASEWSLDYIRVRLHDEKTVNEGVQIDKTFDGDNIYPYTGDGSNDYYKFTCTASDESGGDTINEMRLSLREESGGSHWTMIWDDSAGFYNPNPEAGEGELVGTQSSTTVTGATRTTVFAVRIHFDHETLSNVDFRLRSYSSTSSDEDTYDIITAGGVWKDIDISTAIVWDSTPILNLERCDPGVSIIMSGSVKFSVSGSGMHPKGGLDARVSRQGSAWSTTEPVMDGAFSATCPTSGSAGDSNTFEVIIKTVFGGIQMLDPETVSVILDSVIAYEYGTTDGWIDPGLTTTVYTKLKYYSDSSPIVTGTVSWSGLSLSYVGNQWEATTPSQSSPTTVTYDTLSITTSHGVTTVNTHPIVSIIWDVARVNLYEAHRVSDNVEDYDVDVGTSIYIIVQVQYEEQGGWISDGSISVNGHIFTYTGADGKWKSADIALSEVGVITWDSLSFSSAPSSGITTVDQNSQSCTVIWNTLMVELSVDDGHVNPDGPVRVWAHVTRAYDGSVLASGTVILRHSTSSDIAMIYSPADQMWYADVAQSEVGQWVYSIYSISDSTYGLTTVGRGAHFDGSNGYVNCGSDSSLDLASSLSLSVWFYGDGSNWGSGMYILAKKDDNNAQYALYVHSDRTLKFVYYNSTLREIDLQAAVTRNTWHHVVVTVSGTTLNCWYDGSHVQNDLTLPASLVSFSSVPLYLGAQKSGAGTGYHLAGFISEARIYNTALSDVECELLYLGQCPGTSNLRLLLDRTSFDAADGVWYDLSNSTNDGALNQVVVTAGSIPMSSDEVVRPIWDQIKVVGYTSDNPDIDVGTASSCHATLQYAFDGRPVEDGIVTVNGVLASPGAVLGVWDFSEIKSSAQGVIYDSVSYSGGAYGLSSVDQNSQTITQVWEQIFVLTTTVVDSSIDVGTPAEVRVMARLTYHSSHSLGASDDLYMNGVKMSWSGSYFYYRPTQSDVGLWNYYVNSTGALEDTYGISAVNVTGLSVDITWTGLIIDITDPVPQWVNVGENASGISISVTYAHNGAPYDGTVSLNNTQFIYNDAGRRGYRLLTLTGDDILGITYVITDDETWCIWDGVIITITDPTHQTLIVGQNASGIVVSACYAYDGQPFDGAVQLNNTQFEYLTPGRRGYTVSGISGGSRGIDAIVQNDETYAVWVLQQAMLHLEPVAGSVLVSTLYDPHNFSVDVCLTDMDLNMIPGWVNLTIGGEDYAVYCDGIINATFDYSPITSGEYTLQAVFGGDSVYAATDTSIFLTATSRDIVFVTDLPSEMIPMTPTSFGLFNVYDNDFQGQFQGVTYNRDYPVNTSFSIWWTLSSDYGDPKNYVGTWDINVGEGTGQMAVPWDLDGDNGITGDDFTCYVIIYLDGLGIYENITIETPVNVLQPLEVILQVPALTYSDQATLNLQLRPLYDSLSMEHLDLDVALYVSDDNGSWVLIAEVTTTVSGWIGVNWTCTDSGTLFFKAETTTSEFYIESRGYAVSAADKETTALTIECVGNFTYSDQGVLVALFSTDDGEPLSDYSVYLEIMDGTWVSIGSALTNGSGQASILWTPTLPAGTYSIQLRMLLTESQYYVAPENAMGQLVVGKEFIVVDIDSTVVAQGYVRARVTDDDDNPVEGVQIDFYVGNNRDYRGSGITDTDGYARLNITLNDGELLQAVVNENNCYYGASQEVTVVVPVDLLFLTAVAGIVFLSAAGLAVTRKILRGRAATGLKPASPELRKALKKERDSIPERVREHTERRMAELDEISHGAEETSELSSTTEPGTPPKTGTEGDSD